MKLGPAAVLAALCLAGCAKSGDKIAGSYVSPLAYQDYSCEQLGAEIARISVRAQEVSGVQDEAASDDAIFMGVGIIFWPSFLLLEGDTGREAELARLKGEMDAIEQTAVLKDCEGLIANIAKSREQAEAEGKEKQAK